MTLLVLVVAAFVASTASAWPRNLPRPTPAPDRRPGWALAQVHPRRLDPTPWAAATNHHQIGDAA